MQQTHNREARRIHANTGAKRKLAVSKVHSFQGNVLARCLAPARYHCETGPTVLETGVACIDLGDYVVKL